MTDLLGGEQVRRADVPSADHDGSTRLLRPDPTDA